MSLHDARWILEEIAASDAKLAETLKAHADLKAAASKVVSANQSARHVLTLWLAVRGSNTEEFFKATASLASQTTKVLNE